MKFFKIFLSLSLFFIVFYSPASAQNDMPVLNQIMTKSATLYTSFPTEKVYLHFDKPYYALGDTIWFKAYVTFYRHTPSGLSKVLYVDVLSPRDSIMTSIKLRVKNGVAWGSVPVSQYTYKKGNYRVVAYTKYMNNAGPAYFFNKSITIGDAINNPVPTNISLKTVIVNKLPKISAGIYYKNDQGNPLTDKKVSWTVQREDETIAKGRGQTDKNGFIDISFVNVKNLSLDSAILVTVIDNDKQKPTTSTFPLKSVSKPNDIQFFPEGGQLIFGLRTKVAFKGTKPDGTGIDLTGTISDNTNNVVAQFSSTHLGMGFFMFAPEDGKTYTANITFADGSKAAPELPKMITDDITLGLENSDPDVLGIKLQADPAFIKDYGGKTFFILAKSSGVICYAAKAVLQNQFYGASVPKSKFPTGIVQVTLFTFDGEPISERIAFIQHNDQLNLAVNSDHPTYNTRQMAKLNITAKNGGQPDEGNFSVSVIDETKVPFDENAETTILTNLLLTSDIKGYIEKPNYYFNHPNEKTADDLDVLLLTQGYRRFSYDDILNNKFPAINYGAEQGIDISGSLRASNGIPVNRGNVHLLIPDKNFSTNATTDVEGRFKFSDLTFLDSAKVTLSARGNDHASDLVLTVDNGAPQNAPLNYDAPDEILNIDSALGPYLQNSKMQFADSHILKEVVIKDKRIVKTVSHRDYGSLASLSYEADHTIKPEALQGCPNLLQCLTALAVGMTFQDNNFYIMRNYTAGQRTPVAIFLKGAPVDVNTLNSVNPAEVESVEIFLEDELGLINSAYGTDGAIVVNMKKAPEGTKISYQELKDLMPQKNEITFNPQGYAAVKAFYLPRYTGPRQTQSNKLDLRTTIYWNPNINTDKTGAASLEYYNPDSPGTYRVTIEGIDKDGNLGREVFRYAVK